MVIEIKKYECEICGRRYQANVHAVECEAKGRGTEYQLKLMMAENTSS